MTFPKRGDVASPAAGLSARAGRLRKLSPMMASILLVGTGNSLLTTSVSLALDDPGIDPRIVRLLLTGFPAGFLAGCLAARFLVKRLGHRRSFLAIGFAFALGAFGYVATQETATWFLLRALSGFAMATLFVVCESWINLYSEPQNRGSLFSLYMLMTSLAVLFGQLTIEAAGPHSPHLFLIGALTVSAGFLFCCLAGPWPALPPGAEAEPLPGGSQALDPQAQRFGMRRMAMLVPVTIVAVFQAGMTNMNVSTLTPIYGARIGLPADTTVGLLTAFSLGGIIAQSPVGWLSDRVDRRSMLLAQGLAAAALCVTILVLGNRNPPILFCLFLAYGGVALTIYPVGIGFANSQLESRNMVAASGGLLLLYSLGNILTPSLATKLMEVVSPEALFALLGGGGALVAITAIFNLRRGRMVPAEVAPMGRPGSFGRSE